MLSSHCHRVFFSILMPKRTRLFSEMKKSAVLRRSIGNLPAAGSRLMSAEIVQRYNLTLNTYPMAASSRDITADDPRGVTVGRTEGRIVIQKGYSMLAFVLLHPQHSFAMAAASNRAGFTRLLPHR